MNPFIQFRTLANLFKHTDIGIHRILRTHRFVLSSGKVVLVLFTAIITSVSIKAQVGAQPEARSSQSTDDALRAESEAAKKLELQVKQLLASKTPDKVAAKRLMDKIANHKRALRNFETQHPLTQSGLIGKKEDRPVSGQAESKELQTRGQAEAPIIGKQDERPASGQAESKQAQTRGQAEELQLAKKRHKKIETMMSAYDQAEASLSHVLKGR